MKWILKYLVPSGRKAIKPLYRSPFFGMNYHEFLGNILAWFPVLCPRSSKFSFPFRLVATQG